MGVHEPRLHPGVTQRRCLYLFPRVLAQEEDATPHMDKELLVLPECMRSPPPLPPESGWDRIQELFKHDKLRGYSEEVNTLLKGALTGVIVGFVYGGVPAARHARSRFIEQSQAEVFRHRVEAVRAAHNAALRGFIRYGWRWGWRVAAFVTLFNSASLGLSVYRDKNSLVHYAAAGAVTGGLFRLSLGLRGVVGGTALGVILGVPVGAMMTAVQAASGETLRERRRREQRELYQLKLDEWAARLDVTQAALEEASKSVAFSEIDTQRIEELLSLPRNPELPESKV
ncbi:complex I assembly factor TIMMDC1, mitochondrial [Pleurodeles waltl]|uniref:complex I assembly factor TIMMDC1, mitochondrial n=1 Tax=Pleurodeles waltl TaxID=8319 RepID=UPI003709AEC3